MHQFARIKVERNSEKALQYGERLLQKTIRSGIDCSRGVTDEDNFSWVMRAT